MTKTIITTWEELYKWKEDHPNCYIADMKFEGLDYTSDESVTIVGNNEVWSSEQPEIHDEEMPDVELTLDKILDGYPLMYHLAAIGSRTLPPSSGQSNVLD